MRLNHLQYPKVGAIVQICNVIKVRPQAINLLQLMKNHLITPDLYNIQQHIYFKNAQNDNTFERYGVEVNLE